MCVKLLPEDLNLDPYLPHPTSTYTCEVTIAPRMCGSINEHINSKSLFHIA